MGIPISGNPILSKKTDQQGSIANTNIRRDTAFVSQQLLATKAIS